MKRGCCGGVTARALVAASMGLWAGGMALAQGPATTPAATPAKSPGTGREAGKPEVKPPTSPLAPRVIQNGRFRDWTFNGEVRVDSWEWLDAELGEQHKKFEFTNAVVVFPALRGSSTHRVAEGDFTGELQFGTKIRDEKPTFLEGYHSGARLARWELTNGVKGRTAKLNVTIRMYCYEVTVDEALARTIPWPGMPGTNAKDWGPTAKSTFEPQMFVDYSPTDGTAPDVQVQKTREALRKQIMRWTNNKDPKALPPYELAKFLTGRVQEAIQLSGEGRRFNRNSGFAGFEVRGVAAVLAEGRGNVHEMPTVLAAVLREAGIPARLVVGVDYTEEDRGSGEADSYLDRGNDRPWTWVEFALADPFDGREIWIPVDISTLRKKGSRARPLNTPWKYFGTNDNMDYMLPLSFSFHPPTTVVSHGYPLLWGWLTTPNVPQATQSFTYRASMTGRRAEDQRRDREERQTPRR